MRQGIEQGGLIGAAVYLLDEAAVRLDEIGSQAGHVRKAGDPGAQVVHGHAQSEAANALGKTVEDGGVVDALGFGELHDDASGTEGQGGQPAGQGIPESRGLQTHGFKVHEMEVRTVSLPGHGLEGGLQEAHIQQEPLLGKDLGILQEGAHGMG